MVGKSTIDVAPPLAPAVGVGRRDSRARLFLWARIAITIAAFVGLVYMVRMDALISAVRRIPLTALVLCVIASLVSQLCGAARFRWLLAAYGARRRLGGFEAARLQLVSFFYNTYLPGAVAGDLVRAVAVRSYFPNGGLTGSLAVSFVERVMGLAAVLVLAAVVSLVRPIAGIRGLLVISVLGVLASAAAVFGLALGPRLQRFLPGRIGKIAGELPAIRDIGAFGMALLVSLLAHVFVACGFHAVVAGLSSNATLADSLVIVPLASTAAYIPATVAGAGTRDAAFVLLYKAVGVSQADALAVSLSVFFCTLLVAALGGVANTMKPPADQGTA